MLPILLAFFLSQASGLEPSSTPAERKSPAQADITADKEVSASSGPVQLAFRIYKTRFKAGESLWYQLQVTNRGKKMFRVSDEVFDIPFMLRSGTGVRGVFLIVTDAKGRAISPRPFPSIHRSLPTEPYVDVEGDPKLKAMIQHWKKEGLSDQEVFLRSVEYTKANRSAENRRNAFVVELKPGESIVTPPWAYDRRTWIYDEPWKNKPAAEPIGKFAELEMFSFDKPGTYRIKAVYDSRYGIRDEAELQDLKRRAKKSAALREILAEKLTWKPAFYEVRAETRWIEVTVTP